MHKEESFQAHHEWENDSREDNAKVRQELPAVDLIENAKVTLPTERAKQDRDASEAHQTEAVKRHKQAPKEKMNQDLPIKSATPRTTKQGEGNGSANVRTRCARCVSLLCVTARCPQAHGLKGGHNAGCLEPCFENMHA